ncbi:MAG: prepilin peptidase [bacterium]
MFNLFFSLIVLVFGLIVGSFLNCVIYRLEENKSFLRGRSFCPQCKHVLAWYDLIPVFSFLWLNGKCCYCKKPISPQYPLIELATGVLFVFIYDFLMSDSRGMSDILFYFVISGFLMVIFVYDLKHYLIPDKVVYPAIVITLVYDALRSDLLGRSELLISAFGAAGFFLAIVLISRGKWMGIGDIKFAFLMGLILGWPNILVALFFAFFSGAIIGLGLVMASKKSFKSEVPFGPFLVAGTIVAMLYGKNLINWYLGLF